MIRVGISGAHGVGKTSLAEEAARALREQGWPTKLTPEIARRICRAAADDNFLKRDRNTLSKQLLIIAEQLVQDRQLQTSSGIVISDRTMLDHWAYTTALHKNQLVEEGTWELFEDLVKKNMAEVYHALVYIPPEFPPKDDGVRESDPQFQRIIHEIMMEDIRDWELSPTMVTGSLEERVSAFINVVLGIAQRADQ